MFINEQQFQYFLCSFILITVFILPGVNLWEEGYKFDNMYGFVWKHFFIGISIIAAFSWLLSCFVC